MYCKLLIFIFLLSKLVNIAQKQPFLVKFRGGRERLPELNICRPKVLPIQSPLPYNEIHYLELLIKIGNSRNV